jgi:phosphonatase-like hydrolase
LEALRSALFSRVKLFVFDMAGTTVDGTFAVHDSLIQAFRGQNLSIDRTIASRSIAVPKPVGISTILKENFKVEDEKLRNEIHDSFLRHMNAYYASNTEVKEMEGSTELFNHLNAIGVKVVLDTGFGKETADIIIERLQWSKLIAGCITSDLGLPGRPDPAMIHRAMSLVGCQYPNEVIKVGDTPTDILQGKNAGCLCVIGVNSGTFAKELLWQAGADLIVEHPKEIYELIQQNNA